MMHDRNFAGNRAKRLKVRHVSPGEMTAAETARLDAVAARRGMEAQSAERLIAAARGRIDDERLDWVVARVTVGQERIAVEDLKAAGIAVWCPLAAEKRAPKRGMPAVTVERPIFTGYVFLRLPSSAEAWVGAGMAGRLIAYLGQDGVPARIPERMINALMIKVKSPEVAHVVPRFRAGMTAMLRNGPFADFEAKITRVMSGRGRAEVEVSLFGQIVPTEIDLDQLRI